MSKKIVLGNHLVPEILAHLEKIAPLPKAGIVAGQAVCSAILDLYGGGGGVYNDIDVFLPATAEKLAYLNSMEHLKEESLRLGLPLASLDEYNALSLSSSQGLNIAGCEESDKLNYVWCDISERDLLPGSLVYSFDLNAVEVAIDLEFQELTWSKGFETFLNTRELEITSLATPERTLLRYLKKRSELPSVYGQDELVKNMVATWMASELIDYEPKMLTTKSQALVKQFQKELDGIFECADDELRPADGWTITEELEAALSDMFGDCVDPEGLVRIAPSRWYALKRGESAEAAKFAEELNEYLVEQSDNGPGVWENIMQAAASIMGGDYVKGLRSETHRDVVLAALQKHEGLNSALQGLTLDEQYRCVRDLNKRAKHQAGPLIFGFVESLGTPVDMWNQHHRDQFFRQMGRERQGGELCERLFETYNQDGWTIRELVRTSELRAEGYQMNHCVGGYSSAVRAGHSRILSVRHADNPAWASTIEIRSDFSLRGEIQPGTEVRIAQNRTYRNAEPSVENRDVVKQYVESECARLGLTLPKKRKAVGNPLGAPALALDDF